MKNTRPINHAVYWMRLLAICALVAFTGTLHATGSINVSPASGLALHGYDPVAYFVNGEPRRGDDVFRYEYQDVTWRFSNAANKQAFIESPESYLPQYGGFCAYAASKNALADIDPAAWTIHDDKLYLNYSLNVRQRWRADRDLNIRAADKFWPELAKQVK